MIKLENVSKIYSTYKAVDQITFSVQKGEILGFLGPNGAGKTTTMRMITGSLATSSGEIYINGKNNLESPIDSKRLIGYLPEVPPLYKEMTVLEFLNFTGHIKELKSKFLKKRIESLLEECNLDNVKNRLIKHLSRGYQQRTGIASALINDPPILILDEPTIGLDPAQIIDIRKLIKNLGVDRTVILSTHILSEVSMTCSRVIIINNGKLIAEDSVDNLSKQLQQAIRIVVGLKRAPTEPEKIISTINRLDGVKRANFTLDNTIVIETSATKDLREEIAKKAVHENWGLVELKLEKISLEDIFLKLTGKEKSS